MQHYLALWFLVRVAGRLPATVLNTAADMLGTLAWFASPRLRAVTRDHMRHVLGPFSTSRARDRAARGCARSAARYYADFARGPYLSPEAQFAAIEEMEGADHLFAAVDRGCGVIMLSAHIGNPEFISRSVGRMFGIKLLVLTEPLSPPRLEAFVQHVRATPETRFVPVGIGGARTTLEHLRAGGSLGILADRDVLGSGQPVTFFGERTLLPSGPVELALRTGAALVPGFVLRSPRGGLHIVMLPALELPRSGDREADLAAGMRLAAAALEAGIARAPDQWFALSPVWSGLAH